MSNVAGVSGSSTSLSRLDLDYRTWSLNDSDRALLRRLVSDLRRLQGLAKSNDALVTVGEVVEAVEKFRNGEHLEPAVLTLSVGIQDGNPTFHEGWFARIAVSPDGIVLDKLNTTYLVELGHEREATKYAVLKPSGDFDSTDVIRWLTLLNELRRWSTAELLSERVAL